MGSMVIKNDGALYSHRGILFSAVSVLAKTHLSPFTLYCEASRFFLTFY